MAGKVREPAVDRFERLVEFAPFGDCWIWMGVMHNTGYGKFRELRQTTVLAHRFAYAHYVAPIPAGACVLHRCDNPKCVNPAHLFLGSKADNMRDMHAKGRNRQPKGERSPSAKLTSDLVLQMRAMAGSRSVRAIAANYGVDHKTASKAIRGETWKHLS